MMMIYDAMPTNDEAEEVLMDDITLEVPEIALYLKGENVIDS